MFTALKPLLSSRSLVLTLASLPDDLIRVTVTPRSTGADAPKSLMVPFVVEGTAAELDGDLPAALVGYVAEHMTLTRALASLKETTDAALKEAMEEAAKKIADAKKGKTTAASSSSSSNAGAKVEVKPEPKAEVPPMALLFDSVAPAPALPVPQPVVPAVPAAPVPVPASRSIDDEDDEEAFLLRGGNDALNDQDAAA